jgi:transcriptional regulator with GAF, ATPase, and Fis domain
MNTLKSPQRQEDFDEVDTFPPQGVTERERRLLFSFNNDIAGVQNERELLQLIQWKFKKLLGFSDVMIGIINGDGYTFSDFLSQPDYEKKYGDHRRIDSGKKYEINELILNGVFNTAELQIYDLNRLEGQKQQLPVYLEGFLECGIRYAAVVRLANGDHVFGFWLILFERKIDLDTPKSMLISAFAEQIAAVVYNMITDEKPGGQIIEISKYQQLLAKEQKSPKKENVTSHQYPEIVGQSAELRETFRLIGLVAPSDSTVLICGETGTGKELIARAIHDNSRQRNQSLIKVNCAALPASLIESELFGHERGSFTGAFERRIGKFEMADNGTLFLDEIGELPLELQVKLLRALQEKEIERVGGKNTIKVNVRIIAATNRDLQKDVQDGKFRSDLYYRLNVFPIHLAPLRNRREDIPLLVSHFVDIYSGKSGRPVRGLSSRALQDLMSYEWPGNIRELEHFIERSVLLACGDKIENFQMPFQKKNVTGSDQSVISLKTIAENEFDHILSILKYCNGRIAGRRGAADILGVPPTTLNSKIKRFGIRRTYFSTDGS